ncbi:MAG: cation transporter [Christensenellaceae bacterium]|nr:cation transporter [Christensenellaceae bacterium]
MQDRKNVGIIAGIIGITVNIALFVFKLIYGIKANSIAIQADAFNNLMDILSSAVVIVGFKLASKKADSNHPFGHGRLEYLSGLVVAFLILLTGVELAQSSFERIITPEAIISDISVYIMLIVSILAKLFTFAFNRHLGKKISSPTLIANAKDSLSDVFATSAVLLSVIVFDTSGAIIDAYIGLIVSLLIIYSGYQAARDTINPLIGDSSMNDVKQEIESFMLEDEHIRSVHDTVIHNYGFGNSMLTSHVVVDSSWDLLEIHDVVDKLERVIKQKWGFEATIHIDPDVEENEESLTVFALVESTVKQYNSSFAIHDFRLKNQTNLYKIFFDIDVPYKHKQEDEAIIKDIIEKVKAAIDKDSKVYIDIDRV